jgi:hypothetical protein
VFIILLRSYVEDLAIFTKKERSRCCNFPLELEQAQSRRMALFEKWSIKLAQDAKKKEVN